MEVFHNMQSVHNVGGSTALRVFGLRNGHQIRVVVVALAASASGRLRTPITNTGRQINVRVGDHVQVRSKVWKIGDNCGEPWLSPVE